jgi:acyl carrier protein
VTSDTLTNLISLVADYACVPEESILISDQLADHGIDSLDHAQLIIEVEDLFEIELPQLADLTTIATLHDAIVAAQS